MELKIRVMAKIKLTKKRIEKALTDAYKDAGENAYFGNGFREGVKWALEQVNEIAKYSKQFKENCGIDMRHFGVKSQIESLTPPELKTFLKEKGAWDRFVNNIIEQKTSLRPNDMLSISNAFKWIRVPEGFDYWDKLNDEYLELSV